MDTDVRLAALDLDPFEEERAITAIAQLFADTEQRFSRFDPESELGRLNRSDGPVQVSPEMLELLDAARAHVVATGGLFDPAIGGALERAGYDRSFVVDGLDRDSSPNLLDPNGSARFADLRVDRSTRTVVRPPHLHLDFGGFLKGRTVDRAAAMLPASSMIEAGGDAVLRGAGPTGRGWEIDVEDPADPERTILRFLVRDRGVATSAPNRRRWRLGDGVAHHLIDPRTARPASEGLAQVTAIAPTAEQADVLAKVAFLLGPRAGAASLARGGLGGVLVDHDGGITIAGAVDIVEMERARA